MWQAEGTEEVEKKTAEENKQKGKREEKGEGTTGNMAGHKY